MTFFDLMIGELRTAVAGELCVGVLIGLLAVTPGDHGQRRPSSLRSSLLHQCAFEAIANDPFMVLFPKTKFNLADVNFLGLPC